MSTRRGAGTRSPPWVPAAAVLAVLAGLGLGAETAAAQSGASRNAATWYDKSFERLAAVALSDAELQALRHYQVDSGEEPPAEVRAALLRLQPVFSAIRYGSRQDYSDFGLEYEHGFDLQLPHLQPLRQIARLMAKGAEVKLHDGDAAGAARDLAAIYGVAGHLSDDRVVTSSLVGQVIFGEADRVAESGLDRSAFGPVESGTLLARLEGLGGHDPFDLLGGLSNEQQVMVDWVRQKYGAAEDRASILDELSLDVGAADTVAGLMLLDESQFEAALEGADQLMTRVVELFALDDPVDAQFELDRITAELKRGDHGALAAVIVPNCASLYKQMLEAQAVVGERSAVLRAIVDGTLTPADLANAAVWYLQAVHMLAAIDPPAQARLREIAADPRRPVDDQGAESFASSSQIIDTLRSGARMKRCDFSIAGEQTSAIPGYLTGLREAVRLLHADAIRHLQRGEPEPAADRLAICYRLSAHLAVDPVLCSSLVSHVVFDTTDALVRWAGESFTTAQRAQLEEAVRAMGLRDPFGYLTSMSGARAQIVDRLGLRDEAQQRARETVRRLGGDHLLYMLVVVAAPDPVPPEERRLDDVLSYPNLARAVTEAEETRRLVADTGDLDLIGRRPVPIIGQVDERFERSRADLRRALTAFRTASP